jgi:hypothetical protein
MESFVYQAVRQRRSHVQLQLRNEQGFWVETVRGRL